GLRATAERAGAASSRVPPRGRSPEQREVRVEPECAAEPRPRLDTMTEAALDHPAVEELQRVEGSEAERPPRVLQRLAALAVSTERPRESVVAVDRRPL